MEAQLCVLRDVFVKNGFLKDPTAQVTFRIFSFAAIS